MHYMDFVLFKEVEDDTNQKQHVKALVGQFVPCHVMSFHLRQSFCYRTASHP